MLTLKTPVSATVEIKQSKFIAHLVPYSAFETTLQHLRTEHPKGRHFVTAFRYLNEHMQVVEGSSDDGEPKGTSGKPSLAVLAGHDLIDAAVIIVRYFGGTKLGTGGLVRAYTQAVSDVVALAELTEYIPQVEAVFTCGYSAVSQVEYLLGECGVSDVEKSFGTAEVRWNVRAGREVLEIFFERAGRRLERLC
ncbi:YigZ family protein [Sulfurimonas sp. HSL-1656]|uniref:IMPACT family protein n=1 Tax=Thiomicrolovo subterrani TaxID=3131934 RepID=UPI0031FA14E9